MRNSIRAALDAVPEDHSSAYAALVSTYADLRRAVATLVPDDVVDEYDSLFPSEIALGHTTGLTPQALFRQQEVASEARTRLGQLAGWLDGFIEAEDRHERRQP